MKRRTVKKRAARRLRATRRSIKRSLGVSYWCWEAVAMAREHEAHKAAMARLEGVRAELEKVLAGIKLKNPE